MNENQTSSNWKTNYNLDKIDTAVQGLKDHIQHIEKVANAHTGKVMPVNSADFTQNIITNIDYYNSRKLDDEGELKNISWRSTYNNRPLEDYNETVKVATSHVTYWFNKACAINALNEEALANNVKILENIKMMMTNLGIPETYVEYRYKTKRSRYMTEFRESAGWVKDVNRCIKRTDGFALFEKAYQRQLERIEEWATKKRKELFEVERAKASEQHQREQVMKRAVIIARYDVPQESQADDCLLLAILDKNKYLKLAYKLLCIRNDFDSGYKYAKYAIDEFEEVTKTDVEIVRDINDCIEQWDGDGRIFRDTTWSYDRIFTLVQDEQLYTDYTVLRKIVLDMD